MSNETQFKYGVDVDELIKVKCREWQSEFLKMFPRANRGEDGLIVFCPKDFDSKIECGRDPCGECRKKYWLEEVE